MIKKNILILIIFFYSVPNAFSAEWQLFFESANGSSSYIDINSVNHLKNGNVRAWTKYSNESGDGTLSLTEINCAERTFTIRAMEPTDPQDLESVNALNYNVKLWSEPTQEWEHIGTSDLAEKEYEVFCRQQ